jgi:hypothetical protein
MSRWTIAPFSALSNTEAPVTRRRTSLPEAGLAMTPTVAKLVLPDDGAGDMGDKRANETMFCVPDKPWEVNAATGGVGWSGNA